jgi:hypothetical protein
MLRDDVTESVPVHAFADVVPLYVELRTPLCIRDKKSRAIL